MLLAGNFIFIFSEGVIESPETLKCIATTYTKAVVWYLLKYAFSTDNINRHSAMENMNAKGR